MVHWPKTYRFLADCNDAAADEALVTAVRQFDGAYLRYAVEVLLHRARPAGLLALIENYHRLSIDLKHHVLTSPADLAPALRNAIRGIELQTRINCLEMAGQLGQESLAYLFDMGLMDTQVRVREAAALMMRRMTRDLVADHPLLCEPGQVCSPRYRPEPAGSADSSHEDSPQARLTLRRRQMLEALLSSTLRYDKHLHAEVVEACIWFEPYLGQRLQEMLQQKRSRLGRLIGDMLTHSDEPLTARFLPQALAMAELRPMALKAISERRDPRWFQGVLQGVDLWLPWPRVRKAFAFVKHVNHLDAADEAAWGDMARGASLPALIGASNLPVERKDELFSRLWHVGSADCRRQVLLEAGHSSAHTPVILRTAVCESRDPQEARMAGYLLRRNHCEGLVGCLTRRLSTRGDAAVPSLRALAAEEIFWRLWTQFDLMPEERRVAALAVMRTFADRLKIRLRVHMAAASSTCRVRSVRIVGMLGLVDVLWGDLAAVAKDPNSRVRSAAVRLLGRSNRPEVRDLLLAALEDKDGRVQSNAIEAIDETAWPDKTDLIVSKLHSEHNRVRANAARMLSRAGDEKAGQILTTMLQDSRFEHRMTAIWTIRALGPTPWMPTLLQLAEHDPSSAVRRFAQTVCRQAFEATSGSPQGKAPASAPSHVLPADVSSVPASAGAPASPASGPLESGIPSSSRRFSDLLSSLLPDPSSPSSPPRGQPPQPEPPRRRSDP